MIELDRRRPLWAGIWLALIVLAALAALRFGARDLSLAEIGDAIWAFDPQNADHVAFVSLRAPRIPATLLVGAALGAAGAIMQALTRNPLADPGLFGVNGGAAAAVVTSVWLFGMNSPDQVIWPALAGALCAASLVFVLAGALTSAADPSRLVLIGAALGALFMAVTWALLMISRQSLDVFRFWVIGGFRGVGSEELTALWPFFAAGALLAVGSAALLNALLLGEDTARSLGVRVGPVRAMGLTSVVLLCGPAVATAGPIAFVGLLVPHLARAFSGADMRWLVLFSALCGAGLTTLADLAGRIVLSTREVEAGAMVAVIGGPALVLMIRSRILATN